MAKQRASKTRNKRGKEEETNQELERAELQNEKLLQKANKVTLQDKPTKNSAYITNKQKKANACMFAAVPKEEIILDARDKISPACYFNKKRHHKAVIINGEQYPNGMFCTAFNYGDTVFAIVSYYVKDESVYAYGYIECGSIADEYLSNLNEVELGRLSCSDDHKVVFPGNSANEDPLIGILLEEITTIKPIEDELVRTSAQQHISNLIATRRASIAKKRKFKQESSTTTATTTLGNQDSNIKAVDEKVATLTSKLDNLEEKMKSKVDRLKDRIKKMEEQYIYLKASQEASFKLAAVLSNANSPQAHNNPAKRRRHNDYYTEDE